MSKDYNVKISEELGVYSDQVEAAVALLDEGATIPFISRYRKERTGGLNEVVITNIRDRVKQLRELDKRRETVLATIKEQGKLTDALKKKILASETLSALEDIYLPYRPKRRTKATIAKEKGLEPLAQSIFEQKGINPSQEAKKYLDAEKGVKTVEEALAGARDIIAEWINENAQARQRLRVLFQDTAVMRAKLVKGKDKDPQAQNYRDYFDWQELAKNIPSHRMLAVRRAEKETFLTVRIQPDEDEAVALLTSLFLKGKGADSTEVCKAAEESYKRLLSVSLESELRMELKKKADKAAIEIFKNNLRELLMAPPLGEKRVLAVDPGLRTGCKMVCLNERGDFLKHETVYLVGSELQKEQAAQTIKDLCKAHDVQIVAVGNGTASRETEQFIRSLKLHKKIDVVVVSETGASVYSASEVARAEFPDFDVTVRGAISIGRRLMDPLAELVKIDPKSIGVGQYQHDVDQKLLKESLDDVVISCVNRVGVEVNFASKELLSYVSGLGPVKAQALIDYRAQNGSFASRKDFMNIAGFGGKVFEQAAGFLRIRDAENPLDTSAVHPESYELVERMAEDLNCGVKDLMTDEGLRRKINPKDYESGAGAFTLKDILDELAKPGRDPREPFKLFQFKDGINELEDLKAGMKLPGVVTNVTAFGAFVDIGVHQDGLVHISQLSHKYIKDPHEVVKVHQKIEVTVLEVDMARRRIALSAKE